MDGVRRRPRRVPRRARGARAPGGGEVDVERVYRHPRTTPLDPETGQITGERAHVAFAVAAMRVVAEVDVELGLTRVVWIGTAQDVGKAINPQAVDGQIEGGTAQGLGLALMEEIQTRDGLITNASFTDYLIPTALDMPPVVVELVEDPEPDAPYGAKGVGEPPTVVSTAAIAAAVRDATGRAPPPASDPHPHPPPPGGGRDPGQAPRGRPRGGARHFTTQRPKRRGRPAEPERNKGDGTGKKSEHEHKPASAAGTRMSGAGTEEAARDERRADAEPPRDARRHE